MKKWTQEEADAVEYVDGWKNYGTGNFTQVRRFGEWAGFGERAIFGEGASFGAWASFGAGASFGERASFGELASFEGLSFKNCNGNFFIRVNNIGSRNDGCYVFNADEGIYVRCGCFFGTDKEFLKKVKESHSGTKHEKTYTLAVKLAKEQFKGE